MGIVLKNNARTTLSGSISSLDTTIPVSDTSDFPALGVGDYFYATIESTAGAHEIVKVTQVNASSFVAVRGQESTIAIPFNTGARVELRITVQSLEDQFGVAVPAAVDDYMDTIGALDASDIGVTVQAYDADLTTWAGLTPSANAQSLITAANYAAMRGLLDLEPGTDFYSMSAADTAFVNVTGDTMTGALAIGNGTLTASAPVLDLSQTWNNAAVTFTGLKYNVTDTASASASLLMDLQVGGASRFSVRKDGLVVVTSSVSIGSNVFFGFLEAPSAGRVGWGDVTLWRDAANTLAQRNSTNAQAFRLYNTYTDGSNYERGELSWLSNNLHLRNDKAGTGASRSIVIASQGTLDFRVGGNSSAAWLFNSSGHFLASTDNTYDIGASGANRPRTIFLGSTGDSVSAAGDIRIGSGKQFYWANQGAIAAQADGVFLLRDNAATSFGRLQFGGTTASFPALKRSGAELHARLADDSTWAEFRANSGVFNGNLFCGDGGYIAVGTSGDVRFFRDAAATLALRNSTNAQTFRIYNTFTDASNYERLNVWWSSNTAFIETLSAGTGTARSMVLGSNGAGTNLGLMSAGTIRWRVNSSGHLIAEADNTYDIGAAGATRPRDIYFADQIVGSGATITASTPLLNLTQTWNNGAVTFTGLLFNVTDTASVAASLLMVLQDGGASRVSVRKVGRVDGSKFVATAQDAFVSTHSGAYLQLTDAYLNRDAANALAQRNGVNTQAFRVYNTWTDASNYERLGFDYSAGSGGFCLVSDSLGTGTARPLFVGTLNAATLNFTVQNTTRWYIPTTGHLLAGADNTYDIGASGATRPRAGYFGTNIVSPILTGGGNTVTADTPILNLTQTWNNAGVSFTAIKLNVTDTASASNPMLIDLQVGGSSMFNVDKTGAVSSTNQFAVPATGQFRWLTRGRIYASADGVLQMTNSAATDFGRLQFGGTTSSFPALKRSGAGLQVRLADDSAMAVLEASNFDAYGNIRALNAGSSIRVGNDTGVLSWGTSNDIIFARDAANTLAQRNGTNAQAFRIYNTFTDASNYERGEIRWNGNTLEIGSFHLGTGSQRTLQFYSGGTGRWYIGGASGHFLASADNTYDIGASGASRPRDIYFADQIIGSGATVTASTPMLNLSQTWNNVATTFTGLQLDITDTASANASKYIEITRSGFPVFQFLRDTSSNTQFNMRQAGGTTRFAVSSSGGNTLMQLMNSSGLGVSLTDEGAHVFAQRSTTNAQTFRIYNTYTDASNYERLAAYFNTNDAFIRTESAGTGASRPLFIGTEGATNLTFRSNATNRWSVASSGHFIAQADNAYDIGATGTARPRNTFLSGYLSIGDGVTAPGATAGEAKIYVDTADGDLKVKFADGVTKIITTDATAKEQIWVDASAMKPRTTTGCAALATIETATNRVNVETLDFDAATQEHAWFRLRVPKRFGTSTFRATFHWSHAATTTNFGVVWGIQAQSFGDNEAYEAAWGTAGEVTDTGGTTDRAYTSAQTGAITIANLTAQELVYFQVYRKATDAADTLAVDARLEGITLEFDLSQPSDE